MRAQGPNVQYIDYYDYKAYYPEVLNQFITIYTNNMVYILF